MCAACALKGELSEPYGDFLSLAFESIFAEGENYAYGLLHLGGIHPQARLVK